MSGRLFERITTVRAVRLGIVGATIAFLFSLTQPAELRLILNNVRTTRRATPQLAPLPQRAKISEVVHA